MNMVMNMRIYRKTCQQEENTNNVVECALNYPILHDDSYTYITSAAYTIRVGSCMCFLLMPLVDGTFLPENPITRLKTGHFKVVIVFFSSLNICIYQVVWKVRAAGLETHL